MAVPRYCELCGRSEPVTYAEVERDPGYWRDKRELIASEIRDPQWWKGAVKLDNMDSMCGSGCHMRPLPELVRRVFQMQRRKL